MGHDLLSRFKSSVVLGDKRQSRLLGTNGSRPEQRCQQQALAAESSCKPRSTTSAVQWVLSCGRFERAACLAQSPLSPDTRPRNPGPCGAPAPRDVCRLFQAVETSAGAHFRKNPKPQPKPSQKKRACDMDPVFRQLAT